MESLRSGKFFLPNTGASRKTESNSQEPKRVANPNALRELESRIHDIQILPALPSVLVPLMELLKQPLEKIEVNRIVELVSSDKSIAAQCLRMTNSAAFGRRYEIETVRDAVVALGVWRVSDIVFSCVVPSALPIISELINPGVFWRHALACALVSQRLAQSVRSYASRQAYLAGLVHDLGILVNAKLFPDEFRAAYEKASRESLPLDVAEHEMIGFSHCDSGRMLASAWNLPKDIAVVQQYHHSVTDAPTTKDLTAIVHLSDLLCRDLGLGYGYPERRQIDFTCSPAWLLLIQTCRQMGKPDVGGLSNELQRYFQDVVGQVDRLLGPMEILKKPN